MIFWTSSNMELIGFKSMSQGQNLVKSFSLTMGHIFGPIYRKNALNVCLDEIWINKSSNMG